MPRRKKSIEQVLQSKDAQGACETFAQVHAHSGEAPPPSPEKPKKYQKSDEESNGIIAMMDGCSCERSRQGDDRGRAHRKGCPELGATIQYIDTLHTECDFILNTSTCARKPVLEKLIRWRRLWQCSTVLIIPWFRHVPPSSCRIM